MTGFVTCICLYLGSSCSAVAAACDSNQVSALADSLEQRITNIGVIDRWEYLTLYQDSIEIGPSCVPWLIKALQSANAQARKRAAGILGGLGPEARTVVGHLVEALDDPSAEVRREAAWAIGEIGPEAKMAARALVQAASDSDPHVRGAAVVALGSLGVETDLAKPALTKALEDDGSFPQGIDSATAVCEEAASALTKLPEDPDAIAAILVKAMERDKPMCSGSAGYALASLGPKAMPQILVALRSQRPAARAAAAWALTELQSPQAIPALEHTLEDEYGEVRAYAAVALGRLGPAAAATVPSLTKRLDDVGPYEQPIFHHWQSPGISVSPNAAAALGQIGESAQGAIPKLTVMARNQDLLAAQALLQIDPSNKLAFSVLHEIVEADDEFNGYEAAEALGDLGPRAKDAVPALTALLRSPHDSNRAAAVYALAQIDPTNHAPMQVLIQDLKNEPAPWAAYDACRRLGPSAAEAVPALIELLRNGELEVIEALAGIGRPAVPALVAELKHRKMSVRANAAECLGKIGANAEAAVPSLIVLLNDARLPVRVAAAQALGHIGAGHEHAVPALVRLLEDDYVAARRAAADSLGAFGQRALLAVDPLNDALNDDYKAVRIAASTAIKQIGPSP